MGNHNAPFSTSFNPHTDSEEEFEMKIIQELGDRFDAETDKVERLVKYFYPRARIIRSVNHELSGSFEVVAKNQLLHSRISGQGFVSNPVLFINNLRNVVEGWSEDRVVLQNP